MSGVNSADSWIDCKGNRNMISNNIGIFSLLDGFQVHDQRSKMTASQVAQYESGCDNTFKNNECSNLNTSKGKCVQLKSVTACSNNDINNIIID